MNKHVYRCKEASVTGSERERENKKSQQQHILYIYRVSVVTQLDKDFFFSSLMMPYFSSLFNSQYDGCYAITLCVCVYVYVSILERH